MKGAAGRFAAFVIACCAAAPNLAGAQNGPFDLPDDAFLCYKGKADNKVGAAVERGTTVALSDAFQAAEYAIKKLRGICNPADDDGRGSVDPFTHLAPWQIKNQAAKHESRNATVVDAFGRLQLTTIKEDRLLAPAAASLTMPPPWSIAPPQNQDHDVDHYQCYKVKITPGTPKPPKRLQAELDDRFAGATRTFDVKKPKLLCNPVNKDTSGIKNEEGHLVCYKAKPAKGQAKHSKIGPIQVADQLVPELAVLTSKEDLLCVPALRDPPAQYCGDLLVNQASEECDGEASGCPGQTDVCLDDCTCAGSAARCGDGVLEPAFGEQCEADSDCVAGRSCTTSCTCMDSRCPDTLVLTKIVDESLVKASGWQGTTDLTESDGAELHLRVDAVSGSGPDACGVAAIAGVDPAGGYCRCADDNRRLCDQPGEADLDDCGGSRCTCYLDAPNSDAPGGVPICALFTLSEDVTGTWNVDTGEGELTMTTDQVLLLGSAVLAPCPTCDGDVVLNDGSRDGTCNGGLDDGLPCDAQGNEATYPAPGGGSFSLDCMSDGAPVADGLLNTFTYRTGASSLDVVMPCGPDEADLCHCGRCDNDTTRACRANADCAEVGGECGADSAFNPQSNPCSDQTCTSLGPGPGVGECRADVRRFCDGIVRANGRGLLPCMNDAECEPAQIGVDAGECLIEQYASCMPDDLDIAGSPDPAAPIVAAASCIGMTLSNPVVNIAGGNPGPFLRRVRLAVDLTCAGDPASAYPSCP